MKKYKDKRFSRRGAEAQRVGQVYFIVEEEELGMVSRRVVGKFIACEIIQSCCRLG